MREPSWRHHRLTSLIRAPFTCGGNTNVLSLVAVEFVLRCASLPHPSTSLPYTNPIPTRTHDGGIRLPFQR